MISLEAPSAETELTVSAQRNTQDQIFAGLSWSEGLGKYKLTKVIVLMPRFLVRNNLSYPVVFRQHGVVPRDRAVLAPGERAALRVLRSAEDKMLTIAHSGLNAQWWGLHMPYSAYYTESLSGLRRYPWKTLARSTFG